MSSEEARQTVKAGLERKKEAQRDAELEAQERILRLKINKNHEIQTYTEAQNKYLEKQKARERREAREKERRKRAARDMEAEETVNAYGILCLLILLLTAVTRLNIFVSIALALGLGVFPVAKVYRIYNPIEREGGRYE